MGHEGRSAGAHGKNCGGLTLRQHELYNMTSTVTRFELPRLQLVDAY